MKEQASRIVVGGDAGERGIRDRRELKKLTSQKRKWKNTLEVSI